MSVYLYKKSDKFVGQLGNRQKLFLNQYDAESKGYCVTMDKKPKRLPLGCTLELCKRPVFTVPDYVIALLCYLESELDRIMWNIHQEEYSSPFRNTGNEFVCDTFEVHAYYWGDRRKLIDRPNFKYKDIEISWYKHLDRGDTSNKFITPEQAIVMFNDCLDALRTYEEKHDGC